MGTAAASAGAAGPSQGLRAGWSSGRTEAGVHRGERTSHLRERADDRDSEPDYLLRPTRHGPGGVINDHIRTVLFNDWSTHSDFGPSFELTAQRQIAANLALRFESIIKGTVA